MSVEREEASTMAQEPFINPEERPDLTVDLNTRVGDLTVRQLSEILGSPSSPAKLKELVAAKEPKDLAKEPKEFKDHKDIKDHKDPKEHKDQKDNKDHKDPKDQKDQKEGLAEKLPPDKIPPDKIPDVSQGSEGTAAAPSGLEDVIKRIARLEQEVTGLAGGSAAAPERKGR